MMRLLDLNPDFYAGRLADLVAFAAQETLWQHEAQLLASEAARDGDIDTILSQAYRLELLRAIETAGLADHHAFRRDYDRLAIIKDWPDVSAPPVAAVLQTQLSETLTRGLRADDRVVLLQIGDGTKIILPHLLQLLLAQGRVVVPYFHEKNTLNLLQQHCNAAGLHNWAQDYLATRADVHGDLKIMPLSQDGVVVPEQNDQRQAFQKIVRPFEERRMSGAIKFCLSYLPSRFEAAQDGLDDEAYARVFFEACDQPWAQIGAAHDMLIAQLNAAKTLRFTNSDGTDISFGIDGFTFVSSLLAMNVPGSEVFSAPQLHSANGVIRMTDGAAPPGSNDAVRDITLHLQDGYLTSWHAVQGQELLDKTFAIDAGARYIGEVAIGTNPHLRRPFFSGLLNEKVSGSFHVAFGASYNMDTGEDGRPVKIYNGNESALHWDITTMLYGRHGVIEIDGVAIMQNGLFLAPELDVLNRGWAAVPPAERPAHWQDFPGVFTTDGYRPL